VSVCETLIYGFFVAHNAGVHKFLVLGHLGDYILYTGVQF